MTILVNEDKQSNNIKSERNKLCKKIQGNNSILTESISDENPYDQLKESMREEVWYWDSSYDA